MTTDTPSPLVPKLRFPEFRSEPEWEEAPLGRIADIKLGKMLSGEKHTTGRLLPYLNNIAVRWNEVDTSNLPQMYFEDDELERFGLKAGDVVVCEGGEPGRSAVWDGRLPDLKFQKAIHRVRFNAPFVPHLLVSYLEAIAGTDRFEALFTGGGIKHLTRETFAELAIPLIPFAEQKKIAECLTSLGDLIAAEGRKLEALRRHKQGLMQQLFPQPGEAVPRLRFPEFHNATEWQERRADSLFANRVAKGEEGLPIYSVTMYEGMVQRDTLGRNCHDIEDAASNKKVCKGDIAYNMMRMWQGALGVAIEECLVSPAYVVLAPQKDVVSHFFAYLFKLPSSLQLLTSHSRGLTKDRLRLYYDDFARIPLRCPERVEQQRIADCLASLDDQIAAQTRKTDACRQHKQGLLHQLFPSLEEEPR